MLLIKSLFSQSADKKVEQICQQAKTNNPHQVKRIFFLLDLLFWTSLVSLLIAGSYLTYHNYKSDQKSQFLGGFILFGLGLLIVLLISAELILQQLQKLSQKKSGVQSP